MAALRTLSAACLCRNLSAASSSSSSPSLTLAASSAVLVSASRLPKTVVNTATRTVSALASRPSPLQRRHASTTAKDDDELIEDNEELDEVANDAAVGLEAVEEEEPAPAGFVLPEGVDPHSAKARKLRAIARFREMRAEVEKQSPAGQFLPPVYTLPPQPSFGATNSLTLTSLLAANLHLGHKPRHLSHYMLPYIYGERNGIHIINLEHTLVAMRRAMNVTREIAARGGIILFVGTRLAIHKITVDAARKSGAYFCTEWKEGLITNKERLLKTSTGFDPSKAVQLEPAPGVPALTKQPKVHEPHLLIFLDLPNTMPALYEARQAGIPTIALLDTNMDPRLVSYPIPGNDDASSAVEFVAEKLASAAREGLELRAGQIRRLVSQREMGRATRERGMYDRERSEARYE